MEALRTALTQFVNHVAQTAGVYASVIVIFVYHVVLHKDLPCSCKDQQAQCWLYLLLPVLFILSFILWVDKTFVKTLKYCCKDGYKCHSWICIGKAVCIGLLWVVSVLLDGDWYICCLNKEIDHQELACKNKANITAEEQRIRNKLVGKSVTDGLITLLFIISVAAILSSIQENCKKKKNLLHRIIVEEGENLVETKLREVVKEEVMKKFPPQYKTWGKSFDVIEEIRQEMLRDEPPTQGRNPGEADTERRAEALKLNPVETHMTAEQSGTQSHQDVHT